MKFRARRFLAILVGKHHKCNKNEIGKVWWKKESILVGLGVSQVWFSMGRLA